MQLEIPKFRYLAQDENGRVAFYINKQTPSFMGFWISTDGVYSVSTYGKRNPNWKDTLIDLETDQYDYSDGILRRVEG